MKKLDRTFGVEIEFGLNRDTYGNFKDEFEMRTGEKVNVTSAYNTSVSNNQGITFFYIGILGSDCTVRVQSYWLKDGRNVSNNQCIPF